MKIYFAHHGEYQNPEKVVPYRLPKLYPNQKEELTETYIPMGGLVMLEYSQKGIPKYSEIIWQSVYIVIIWPTFLQK